MLVLSARNEKKQLIAKHTLAIPALSSINVPVEVLVILSEVIIIRQNPSRLLDAFRICEDFFSMIGKMNFVQNKA